MQLSEFLLLRQESDNGFAARFREQFKISCSRVTVRQWRLGERFPAAVDKDRIAELTAGLVTLTDWHELELRGARSRQRGAAA